MSKLIGILVALAAVLTALVLWLGRKTSVASRPGRFWAMVGGVLALMGAACTQSGQGGGGHAGDAGAPEAPQAPKAAPKATRPEAHANWSKIKAAVAQAKVVQPGDFDKLYDRVRAARAQMKKLLSPLVAEGLVSAEAAEVLAVLHGDRTFHYTRQMATCYMGYFQPQGCRDDLEKRLALLARAARQGKLAPEVVAKAERAARRDLELLVRLDAVQAQQGSGGGEAAKKAQQELMTLMAKFHPKWLVGDDDASVKARVGVGEALALMGRLLEPEAGQGS